MPRAVHIVHNIIGLAIACGCGVAQASPIVVFTKHHAVYDNNRRTINYAINLVEAGVYGDTPVPVGKKICLVSRARIGNSNHWSEVSSRCRFGNADKWNTTLVGDTLSSVSQRVFKNFPHSETTSSMSGVGKSTDEQRACLIIGDEYNSGNYQGLFTGIVYSPTCLGETSADVSCQGPDTLTLDHGLQKTNNTHYEIEKFNITCDRAANVRLLLHPETFPLGYGVTSTLSLDKDSFLVDTTTPVTLFSIVNIKRDAEPGSYSHSSILTVEIQ